MREITVFKHEMFGEVRTMVNENGETFFVGKDVAKALGYTNPPKALRDHVDEEDKLGERIVLSGQYREAIFINESGLYSLVLSSKLPQAKDYAHKGYAKNRTHSYYDGEGCMHTSVYLVWTEEGRKFIHRLMSDEEIIVPFILTIDD